MTFLSDVNLCMVDMVHNMKKNYYPSFNVNVQLFKKKLLKNN